MPHRFRAISLRAQTMAYPAKRSKTRCPTHPGALLRDDIIPATGRTKVEIAGLLGISRQHLYDILQEKKPVSPAIAVRNVAQRVGMSRIWPLLTPPQSANHPPFARLATLD